MTVNIQPTERAQGTRSEEPVVRVDIVQVIHETEWSIGQDGGITLQEVDGLGGEAPDVVHAGLVTTVEVLKVQCGMSVYTNAG